MEAPTPDTRPREPRETRDARGEQAPETRLEPTRGTEGFESFGEFLAWALARRRERSATLGVRQFARVCGFRSSGMISMIVAGKRLPSDASLERILDALRVEEPDRRFLRLLVAYQRMGGEAPIGLRERLRATRDELKRARASG